MDSESKEEMLESLGEDDPLDFNILQIAKGGYVLDEPPLKHWKKNNPTA